MVNDKLQKEVLNAVKLAGALVVLNSGLTFQNRWPTFGVRWVAGFSIELVVLILALVLAAVWCGAPGRPVRRIILGVYAILTLGRYLDVTAPALVGRPINLYWDGQHFPRVIAMFLDGVAGWRWLLWLLALVFLMIAVKAILNWAISVIMLATSRPISRRFLGALALMLLTLFSVGHLSRHLPTEHWFALPVTRLLVEQAQFVLVATVFEEPGRIAAQPPLVESDLGRLGNADIFVVFFESYGAIVFDENPYAGQLVDAFAALQRSLAQAGWHAASARVVSSTFGGASWLAHASFLAGLKIADQSDYQHLLISDRLTFIDRFAAAGYRCIALMPGLKYTWPEGQFYPFDEVYDARRLNYRGPRYGWWAIPDQFSLYRVHRDEVAQSPRKPLLVFFPTITSHIPFAPVPPYFPDWTHIDTGTPALAEAEQLALNQRLNGAELRSAYVQSIRYNLRVLEGYLNQYAPPHALFLILGDHQPPALISAHPTSWQVPVHVLSRDAPLIDAFLAVGFQPGLVPKEQVLGGIETLSPLLLKVLDSH